MTKSPLGMTDDCDDELLSDFLDESSQLLDRLNEDLLRLDEWVRALDDAPAQRLDMDLMNQMFRAAHSIKGLSAMLGLGEINALTHKIENVFDAARNDRLRFSPEAMEVLFQAHDVLTQLIVALGEGQTGPDACPVMGRITELLDSSGARGSALSQDAEPAPPGAQRELARASGERAAASEAQPAEAPPTVSPLPPPEMPVLAAVPPVAVPPMEDPFAGIEDETQVPAKYLAIFIDEGELAIDALSEAFLALDSRQAQQELEQPLVLAHRIKGSAATIGLLRVSKLAHLMEDVLQQARDARAVLSPPVVDALLQCTDVLRGYVAGLRRGAGDTSAFSAAAQALLKASAGSPSAKPTGVSPAAAAAPAAPQPADLLASVKAAAYEHLAECQLAPESRCLLGYAQFQPSFPLASLKAELIVEKLRRIGEVWHLHPPEHALEAADSLTALYFAIGARVGRSEVLACLQMEGVIAAHVEELPIEQNGPAAASGQPLGKSLPKTARGELMSEQIPRPAPTKACVTAATKDAQDERSAKGEPKSADARGAEARPNETLRVDIERLDQLMNLSGQLVINKARFSKIGDSLRQLLSGRQLSQELNEALGAIRRIEVASEHGQTSENSLHEIAMYARKVHHGLEAIRTSLQQLDHLRTFVNDLGEAVHQLDRVSDGIQKTVMDTRMVPIGPLFTRFRRVVRDITRATGKDIRLEINGEKTELDKRMIDELGDPLIHMVRNSADHGIELPDAREQAGKPRQGVITLDAFHRGNNIVILVKDDGKGLDLERIRGKAVAKGLISAADAERMTPQQVFNLIWEPGLSTAEKVTEISGRGMGMDIVRSKVELLNGTVDVDSVPGQGTTFTIKLPLTLAILPSLMSEVNGDIFALPLESVVEIVSIRPQDRFNIQGVPTAHVRDRVVSVIALDEVFTWRENATRSAVNSSQDQTLVILGDAGKEIGLIVDRVLGEEDIVIKSVAENYQDVPGVSGASILGDGRVSLILDVPALVQMASSRDTLSPRIPARRRAVANA